MPVDPSGLNFAEGLVITSILSIVFAGICCNTSALFFPINGEGLPLIKIIISPEPLKLTLPSISTSTDGTFLRISLAEPDCAIISWAVLYTFLSIEVLSMAFFEVTFTSSRVLVTTSISIVPRLSEADSSLRMISFSGTLNPM